METVYGKYRDGLVRTLDDLTQRIEGYNRDNIEAGNEPLYYHLITRIKSDESMRKKLHRTGLDETAENALRALTDAIGVRIVCLFIDYVYECVRRLRALLGCVVVTEEDYDTISFIVEL